MPVPFLTPGAPQVLLESFSAGDFPHSFRFDGLETVVRAHRPEEIIPAFRQVEAAVASGLHAAGFVAYEAAAGFSPELPVHENGAGPLVWFAIFRERLPWQAPEDDGTEEAYLAEPPLLNMSRSEYVDGVRSIRERIARGETYQVNFTTRQRFRVMGDQFAFYRRLCRNQPAPFCAWIDTGSHRILSASPELFFSLRDGLLTMKPMKGTAPRMARPADDQMQRERLATSAKERAENLMIVDLVRNDLSRVAETGSVNVPELFRVESYPTLHQMTSTVTARLRPGVGVTDIFRALFPCGSVTGAPKRRTMEIIRELERSPRGVYCGAIGYVSPGGEALFSVAIRTAVIESAGGEGIMGIGSGITWDADPGAEYRECLSKGAFLTREPPDFSLIESLRWDRNGYLLLERHLGRLERSAARFGFRFSSGELRQRLEELAAALDGVRKVRVTLAANGRLTLEHREIVDTSIERPVMTVTLSAERTDSADIFLYHKTTRRDRYDNELRARPECGEVIFLNERGELTEGSYTNIVVSREGELLTPALECGLLPGVLREELIEAGAIREAILTPEDLNSANRFWLINSVRGWREGRVLETKT